ncbi:MAG: hypothetical protein SOR95_10170 [Sutterella sp.]|nr:hypothetical protein [Sutterella sp.]
MDTLPKVAFICVHNACRSQIAEALARAFASDVFTSYSGGTETHDTINADAVRILKTHYQIDMTQNQYPKLISALPPVDIVITMGCNVHCPFLPCRYREDWGLEDPTGKDDSAFIALSQTIEAKVLDLKERIASGQL